MYKSHLLIVLQTLTLITIIGIGFASWETIGGALISSNVNGNIMIGNVEDSGEYIDFGSHNSSIDFKMCPYNELGFAYDGVFSNKGYIQFNLKLNLNACRTQELFLYGKEIEELIIYSNSSHPSTTTSSLDIYNYILPNETEINYYFDDDELLIFQTSSNVKYSNSINTEFVFENFKETSKYAYFEITYFFDLTEFVNDSTFKDTIFQALTNDNIQFYMSVGVIF